ncbi:MAG: hypothetical protein V1897_06585, partial [Pseudomonadota bacterium]
NILPQEVLASIGFSIETLFWSPRKPVFFKSLILTRIVTLSGNASCPQKMVMKGPTYRLKI